MSKLLFIDLETTGTDHRKHGIHQISGMVEIGGQVVHRFDWRVQPNPKAKIEPEALRIGNVTLEQVQAYPAMPGVFTDFVVMVQRYVNRYDKADKFHLVGYNNRSFDDPFLRSWYAQNESDYYGSYFWPDTIDVLVLASQYLIDRRPRMVNFKLRTVAEELGLLVDPDRLHDSAYDVELTRQVYRIVTGIDVEI
jgi:DNA polymerase III subunit epsilon